MNGSQAKSYPWGSADGAHTNAYLLPTVLDALSQHAWHNEKKRVFDLGCGNGSVAAALQQHGYDVIGVDPSESGVALARTIRPDMRIELGSSSDDLVARFGRFPVVISLEVVEHVLQSRQFAWRVYDLLEPGGTAIVSTPYHGYWKNLALALTGKMDAHFTALWECGHIKFWSVKTLTILLKEAGLEVRGVKRVGRVPVFAKSMVMIAHRPVR